MTSIAGGGSAPVLFHRSLEFSDSSSDEDEDERYQRHDQGRLRDGGAADDADGSENKKRPRTEEELAAAYAEAAEQDVANKKAKRKRPTLEAEQLTGVDGLVRLPVEFRSIRYSSKGGAGTTSGPSVPASANYVLKLIEAYRFFCADLAPGMAFEDALLKIQQLGSKQQVKSYLKHMRNDVRKRRVEELFGEEKAERMLAFLEEENDDAAGAAADHHQQQRSEGDHDQRVQHQENGTGMHDDARAGSALASAAAAAVAARSTQASSNGVDNRDKEADPAASSAGGTSTGQGSNSINIAKRRLRPFGDDDSSDDEEIEFDAPASRAAVPTKKDAAPRNPFGDDDDDDDDDNIEEVGTAPVEAGTTKDPATRNPFWNDDDDDDDDDTEEVVAAPRVVITASSPRSPPIEEEAGAAGASGVPKSLTTDRNANSAEAVETHSPEPKGTPLASKDTDLSSESPLDIRPRDSTDGANTIDESPAAHSGSCASPNKESDSPSLPPASMLRQQSPPTSPEDEANDAEDGNSNENENKSTAEQDCVSVDVSPVCEGRRSSLSSSETATIVPTLTAGDNDTMSWGSQDHDDEE